MYTHSYITYVEIYGWRIYIYNIAYRISSYIYNQLDVTIYIIRSHACSFALSLPVSIPHSLSLHTAQFGRSIQTDYERCILPTNDDARANRWVCHYLYVDDDDLDDDDDDDDGEMANGI